jgi:type IV pilus assembly protein PilX
MRTPKLNPNRDVTHQEGVVLVVALILLMVLSILASVSVRGASSTEQVANQTRLKALAQQAAEAALRFCEVQVQSNALDGTKGFVPQAAPVGAGTKYSWETLANWDATDAATNPFVATGNLKNVAFSAAGDAGANTYFKRPPECMSQYLTVGNTKVFVTTARGFGPEVAAKDGTVPKGSEVWLQSVVTMK